MHIDASSIAGPLPTGTVTFLFTDIEGSTELLTRLGDRYAAVLTEHHRLLAEAVGAAGGQQVDSQGDAILAVFPRAAAAVAAAASAQRALAAAAWPAGTQVRVRMGLHTGEPLQHGGRYVGLDLHRGARIAAVAHGGQVLVSPTTRELVEGDLREDLCLRDLGEHRLKDLGRPVRLSQLCIEGLPADFPPARSLENRPTNLPMQATTFIGRQAELAQVAVLLSREEVRLLTLTGPGGSGKTRLALQVAADVVERYPQGVYFVALAALDDPALLVGTIARTLGVSDQGERTLEDRLRAYLADRRMLLVLDNFEQITDGATTIAELLSAAPALDVLATSRSPLRLSAERTLAVRPLAVPGPAEQPPDVLGQYDAVVLFLTRAQDVRPDFVLDAANAAAVADICHRLDGLPLALELAAARLRLLSPHALLDRLQHSMKLLSGGARDLPARQRTLRAAIQWSHDLLDEDARRLLARLSVFQGSWTLDAMVAVCEADEEEDLLEALTVLLDNSLVQRVEDEGEDRYAMLQTIREFAGLQLAAQDDAEQVRRAFVEHVTSMAERAAPELRTRRANAVLRELDAELPNIREALSIALDADDALAVRLAEAAAWYWDASHREEGRRWLARVREETTDGPPTARAQILAHAAWFSFNADQLDEALLLTAESLELDGSDPFVITSGDFIRAFVAVARGDLDAARALLRHAVEVAFGTTSNWLMSQSLNNLAHLLLLQRDPTGAEGLLQQALALSDELDDEARVLTLGNLAQLEIQRRDFDRAAQHARAALALARGGGLRHREFEMRLTLAEVLLTRGQCTEAREQLETLGSMIEQDSEAPTAVGAVMLLSAACAAQHGSGLWAARLLGASRRFGLGSGRLGPTSQRTLEDLVHASRDGDSAEAWDAAVEAGRDVSIHEAVNLARSALSATVAAADARDTSS